VLRQRLCICRWRATWIIAEAGKRRDATCLWPHDVKAIRALNGDSIFFCDSRYCLAERFATRFWFRLLNAASLLSHYVFLVHAGKPFSHGLRIGLHAIDGGLRMFSRIHTPCLVVRFRMDFVGACNVLELADLAGLFCRELMDGSDLLAIRRNR
jgi:hypothetical protein